MSFTARTIMARASRMLQDTGLVRWTALELLDYLNDAVREVATIKPNANSTTVSLTLVAGARQTLPTEYSMLSRIHRNTSGETIRALERREIIDDQIPNWEMPAVLPRGPLVVHVIHDMTNPREFLVVPGNDGTGQVSAVVGVVPTVIPAPASPAHLTISNYTATVPLPDLYQSVLLDFVLHRAYSKDAGLPGAMEKSAAYLAKFNASMGAMSSGEASMSLAAQDA